MLIFFAGAFGYTGSVRFSESEDGGAVVSDVPFANPESVSLSSAIPVSDEYSSHVAGELTEGGLDVDPLRVPQALMHFAEYFLAYQEIRKDPSIRILLMDRSVSGDIAHISWKMREYIKTNKHCLLNYSTSFGRISNLDLELGRMLISNQELGVPPPRSQFLKFAAMQALIDDGEHTIDALISGLGANSERASKLFNDLTEDFSDAFSSKHTSLSSSFELKPEVKNYWNRLLEALEGMATHIFSPPPGEHQLSLRQGNEERWINTNDLDYLTLITIYAILREAWKRNILVIGIVKDTAANELVKTVIPIMEDAGLLRFAKELPRFESDKMLLQANSIVNSAHLKTPWRTFEYDVCFRTISPDERPETRELMPQTREKGSSYVMGAFGNVITCERMFVKSYFQLWSSPNDPTVRSHVFLYDRPCYPQYDLPSKDQVDLVLRHNDTVLEEIRPVFHFTKDSPISDLVMGILQSMGSEPIPEALGHNYPLFLADKKAKWLEEEARKACTAAVELEIARSKLDQQILYESRFRDYRTGIEAKRKNKARKSR